MSFIEGLFIFFAIIFGYFLIVYFLNISGILKKYNISLYGPALLMRTTKGIGFLKKIANKKRLWKAYGSTGIVFCFIAMIVFVLFFLWNLTIVFGFTPEQRAELLPGPEYYLILPGINPIIPLDYLFYIIIAFIVAIVVHEFSHGILTLAQNLKVKSMGLLYMIIPIGAFVEPDEKQMKKTQIGKRMRVYSVGPLSNFFTFFICLLIFSFVFMSAVQPTDGADVFRVYDDTPADEIGLSTGSIIISVSDTEVKNSNEFSRIMETTIPDQTVNISYVFKGEVFDKQVNLTSKYEFYTRYIDEVNETYKNESFLGIQFNPYSGNFMNILKNPLQDPVYSFFIFLALPIFGLEGYNPIISPFIESYTIEGPLAALPTNAFWIIVNILYWVAWLNLMVGIFNILPMVPLDGGYLFSDAIRTIVKRLKKDISDEKSEKIVGKVTLIFSLFILFVILAPIFLRYI
jgi:membrane-associated protease RseP (regulator of RpoE activity)